MNGLISHRAGPPGPRRARGSLPVLVVGLGLALGLAVLAAVSPPSERERVERVERLAAEVRPLGWVVFCTRSGSGDWDLSLMRPDGSDRRWLSSTPDWNEAAPQFSRDGTRLLYRRLPRGEIVNGNRYGQQGVLVVANADGSAPRTLGGEGELAWASWSPDARELACLSLRGVEFVNVADGRVVRSLPRVGFFQQLTWSPDGKWLCGVANSFGTGWAVARMDATTGQASVVSRVDCCTPDWFPDARRLVFSNRPGGQPGNGGQGWTQLWRADADGQNQRLVFGEDGRHIYGGHVSPDGRYVLFSGNPNEDGDPSNAGAPLGLLRLADAPLIGGKSPHLRTLHPGAASGPVLDLPVGWEPCWTSSDAPASALASALTPP